MSTRSSIFMVIKIQFLKFVGFHANPPFLSFVVKVQFLSPPIINLVTSDWSSKQLLSSWINNNCSFWLLGAYILQSDNFKQLKFKVISTIWPELSVKKCSNFWFNDGSIKIQTPLLWWLPCEKIMFPPHSFFHMDWSLISEKVSWRKWNEAFWSSNMKKCSSSLLGP